ncbi:MAG: FHA domain-containing protein [Thermoleophilia bacterium]
MTKVYCQECGYQNTEQGKYCSKCGALLPEEDNRAESTIRYSLESEEREPDINQLRELAGDGISLVVRSGGDMAGEAFSPEGERTTIGRAPDSNVFLDDITVSRNHAVILRQEDGYHVQDQGSLNGTYVNHVRIETQKLSDGDQLQVGKFKLTFIVR